MHIVARSLSIICSCLIMIPLYANQALNDAYPRGDAWVYHSFDELMSLREYPRVLLQTQHILGFDGMSFLMLGKRLYDQYNPSVLPPQQELKIPKIIHQIWIGSPVPPVFEKYMNSWKKMHAGRGWKYILWTDETVKNLFPLHNQKFYDESESMGVKSDLLKWEIVYRYGGVYADMDFECLKPLDLLHYTYDFYTGFQPFDAFFVQLGAALFAAYPGHPLLKHCIETIKDDWHEKGAPKKSGPVHFSKSFIAMAGKNASKDISFPAFYFYPLGSTERDLHREEWVKQGAYAVHHWAKSWMPVDCRRTEFRTFDNQRSSEVWND